MRTYYRSYIWNVFLLLQVMLTREDLVVLVQNSDGSQSVEHADGTRITTLYQDRPPNVPSHTSEEHVWKDDVDKL